MYSWADPLQSYRTWTASKKRGERALGVISVPCIWRCDRDKWCEKNPRLSRELLFFPRAPPCLPTAHVAAGVSFPMTSLASGFLSLPCWQQLPPDLLGLLCLHCITSATPRDHGRHRISSAFHRWWVQKMCCLYSLFLKGISFSHPSHLTLYKRTDRIVFLIKPNFSLSFGLEESPYHSFQSCSFLSLQMNSRTVFAKWFFSKPCFSGVENKCCVLLT